jgi:heterodisulfide reductase subunit A-like polyferredoxin
MQIHAQNGLDLLEARLRQDLSWLELPSKPWMIQKSHAGQSVIEVAIIGAGMAGLTAGTALSLLGLHPVLFDRAPEGYEGPWVTTARMETLRSPKQLIQ